MEDVGGPVSAAQVRRRRSNQRRRAVAGKGDRISELAVDDTVAQRGGGRGGAGPIGHGRDLKDIGGVKTGSDQRRRTVGGNGDGVPEVVSGGETAGEGGRRCGGARPTGLGSDLIEVRIAVRVGNAGAERSPDQGRLTIRRESNRVAEAILYAGAVKQRRRGCCGTRPTALGRDLVDVGGAPIGAATGSANQRRRAVAGKCDGVTEI